jgi:hypothetical protein
MKSPARCTALRQSGLPCTMAAIGETVFCQIHQPGRSVPAAGAKAKWEGRRRSRREVLGQLRTTADVQTALEETARLLMRPHVSKEEIERARVLATIVNAAAKTIKTAELERQVDELRALVADRLGGKDAA